jgi:hypothetical protein
MNGIHIKFYKEMKIQETGKPEYFYIRFVEDEGSCGEL